MLHLPFVMYADFESVIANCSQGEDCNEDESWTLKTHQHIADGFSVYTKSTDERFYRPPYIYTGENSAERFIDYVLAEAVEIRKIYRKKIPMKTLTLEQQHSHDNAEKCYMCEESFVYDSMHQNFQNKKKVADHCHVTGAYRGAAHSLCNLQLRINPENARIPVIIHNLKGYDGHLILSAVKMHHGKISCIPSNMEKYTSFSIGDVDFIDSCQFMQSSLSSLVENLRKNDERLSNCFPEVHKYLLYNHGSSITHPTNQNDVDMTSDDEQDFGEMLDDISDYRSQPYQSQFVEFQQQHEKVYLFICFTLFLSILFFFINFIDV